MPIAGGRRATRTMFGPPGHLYVYFSYGNHWCMNAVCGPGCSPHAVLLRAAAPLAGVDAMRERRTAARRDRDLCAGPGRLGQAFGIDRTDDGTDLVRGTIRIVDDGVSPPARPGVSARIGLGTDKGEDLPLRFYIAGNENVSRAPRWSQLRARRGETEPEQSQHRRARRRSSPARRAGCVARSRGCSAAEGAQRGRGGSRCRRCRQSRWTRSAGRRDGVRRARARRDEARRDPPWSTKWSGGSVRSGSS